MYLFLFDDGELYKSTELRPIDIEGAEQGEYRLLDITSPEDTMQYSGSEWVEVEPLEK